jgi:hypothetical protein
MDEIDALTKRFKDYIDKVHAAYDAAHTEDDEGEPRKNDHRESSRKMYTVVSPVDAMTSNLKSVLKAIDNAIENIDALTSPDSSGTADGQEVYSSSPGQKKFTDEELDFLVQTFNKILNASSEERKRLFRELDK